MIEQHHIPVLLNECLEHLVSNRSGIYFDGTIGFGGHSSEILKRINKNAKLVATEVDDDAYEYCKNKFSDDSRLKLFKANFSEIDLVSKVEFVDGYDGIFADLGVSSFQLDNPESGFTYRSESKLDLRLDKSKSLSAADLLNTFEEEEIASIIFKYGEEKSSRKIARKIVERREIKKITTTQDLSQIVEELVPRYFLFKTLSRVFQSLRIYVNDELGVLEEFLSKSVELLKKDGRIVILTYHSLEDRIVKDFFKYENLACVCPPEFPVCQCGKQRRLEIITRKPVLPTDEEIKNNLRARSAKLRAAKKI